MLTLLGYTQHWQFSCTVQTDYRDEIELLDAPVYRARVLGILDVWCMYVSRDSSSLESF